MKAIGVIQVKGGARRGTVSTNLAGELPDASEKAEVIALTAEK